MLEQKGLIVAGITGFSSALIGEILGWAVVVLVVSMIGWVVSSLHVLAGWTDDATKLAKLEIVKGVFASIAAAAVLVAVGHWNNWPMIANVIGAFFAGMAGDRLLRPMMEVVIARAAAALEAIFGKSK